MIAEKFKTNHHEFRLKPDDFLSDLPNALLAMDHPSGDGPNSYTVSKITRQAGIKMALSGLGGDELFAGYPVFKRTLALQSKSWIWKLPKPLRIAAGKAYAAAKPGASSEKFLQLLKHSGAGIEHTFPVSRQISTAETVQSILKTLPHADALQQILKKQLNGNHSLENLSKVSIAEMTTYMQNILLRDADQMSMSVALEVRVPFLDYQLVEYVLGISDELKYPTYPKKLLIESIGDLLPSEIIHREKMGFTFPWSLWLKNELRNFCEEKIQALSNRSFINETVLINRWNKFLAGSPLVRWPDIWIGVVLENWLEQNNIDA